jgi:hypothetical protein
MKVGDLVRFSGTLKDVSTGPRPTAVILNMWYNHKDKLQQVDILWASGSVRRMRADIFEVINECR